MNSRGVFRNTLLVAAVLAGMTLSLKAGEEEKSLLVTIDSAVLGKYVWRGLRMTNDPVLQASTSLSYKGLSLSIWENMDLGSANQNEGEVNEIDTTLNYDINWNKALFSLGFIHYDFPNTKYNNTSEVYGGIGLDVLLKPTLTLYYDFDEVKGLYGTFDISHSIGLPSFTLGATEFSSSVELGTGIGFADDDYNNAYFSVNDGGLVDYRASLSVPVSFARYWTLTPSLAYSDIIDSGLDDAMNRNQENWVAGFAIGFKW